MTFTYIWANAEQTTLKREDADGNIAFVPTDPANRDYAEFLASGETAAYYVEPAVQQDLRTDQQKLEDATGLSVAQIKAVLS